MGMGTGINAYAEAYGSAGAGGAFGGALPPGGPGAMGGAGGFETRSHSNSVYVSGTIKVDDGRSLRRATTTPRRPLVITVRPPFFFFFFFFFFSLLFSFLGKVNRDVLVHPRLRSFYNFCCFNMY